MKACEWKEDSLRERLRIFFFFFTAAKNFKAIGTLHLEQAIGVRSGGVLTQLWLSKEMLEEVLMSFVILTVKTRLCFSEVELFLV